MNYTIQLKVEVDPATTALKATDHAEAVAHDLRFQIGRGLLTRHDPQAVIELYEVSVLVSQD
ncbi:MAG: hypothetical protein ACREXP_25675 [Steroidobacteraceae bacterium]